jgi:hypothetical protein
MANEINVPVMHCLIYDRSPVGLPVPELLNDYPQASALHTLLQTVAWEAVTAYDAKKINDNKALTNTEELEKLMSHY